ncbi:ATP-grasp domain-containing protein [Methanonatronarchaeum sp. AMET-Sl]|uniref:ATP-grasp domain-containing protein n=1 Tax=Methanonatronarchaeum sp. AMET-Sl TaxID=3037654 RepID=UPI00244DEEC8|nr:ATP-grasp domain-containing protein [Methanonatronarchaeum sp. AMET-Sl]WGI17261.1 ATP-grasp domain-containing protein [Methanonatronarchaeum sp. AMET-Sl]
MSVLIVGGGLQGFELCYLADKSGRKSCIVDKKPNPIARSISNDFIRMDVIKDFKDFISLSEEFEYIIPATENRETLKHLNRNKNKLDSEILFDFDCFLEMSDKKNMYDVLSQYVEVPSSIDSSKPPWIAKPIYGSGSQGVKKIRNRDKVEELGSSYIVQNYIEGKHYSTEAITKDGNIYEYLTTILEFDDNYGCCRIICNPEIQEEILSAQNKIIHSLSTELDIDYLFDIQTVREKETDETYLIEVNTRFPSQTPIAVYWATGINLLEEMIEPSSENKIGVRDKQGKNQFEVLPTVFEHFQIGSDVKYIGEINLLKSKNFRQKDFDYCEELYLGKLSSGETVGTVIFNSETMDQLMDERDLFYSEIKKKVK